MSDTKTVLEQIKDEYARERYACSWDYAISLGLILGGDRDEITRRYATACCKATQTGIIAKIEKVADQYPYKKSGDRESYSERRDAMSDAFDMTLQAAADPDNIVLL